MQPFHPEEVNRRLDRVCADLSRKRVEEIFSPLLIYFVQVKDTSMVEPSVLTMLFTC